MLLTVEGERDDICAVGQRPAPGLTTTQILFKLHHEAARAKLDRANFLLTSQRGL
jgi:poly-beta-hydroxyalkanoate depolymerase